MGGILCMLMTRLKKFKLYARSLRRFLFLAVEKLDITELFVCNGKQPNFSKLWNERLYPFKMHLHVLCTGTMTDVDGELEHDEAIALQPFTKFGIPLAVFLGFGGKVKENKNPHNAILADS